MIKKLVKDILKISKTMIKNDNQKAFDLIQRIIKNNSKYFVIIN